MNIEAMLSLAEAETPKTKWVKYRPVWNTLRESGHQPKEAAAKIGEWDKLSESEVKKLTNQIYDWVNKEKKKSKK